MSVLHPPTVVMIGNVRVLVRIQCQGRTSAAPIDVAVRFQPIRMRTDDIVDLRPGDVVPLGHPTSTPLDSHLIQEQIAVYKASGIDPILLPRNAGSWPGYVFTGDRLRLPAGHFGLGHGNGAHAPDEYYVIDSANPKVQGIDGAVRSYVEYLYAMGAGR